MKLSEKLKSIRKQLGMSQEQMAEKLCVSRQAVTKWETGAGTPDIDNLISISKLFSYSLDELLSEEIDTRNVPDFLYESNTEYDIDYEKGYDIKLCGANTVTVTSSDNEKVKVRIASNKISDIQSKLKVKIDDLKNRIDIDFRRFGDLTETSAKENIFIFISLPEKYIISAEVTGTTNSLNLNGLKAENFEFSGKTKNLYIQKSEGHIEIDSNQDLDIVCSDFSGKLDINQISSTSQINVPYDFKFNAVVKGRKNHITYTDKGETTENFSDENSETIIELNGIKSELNINRISHNESGVL